MSDGYAAEGENDAAPAGPPSAKIWHDRLAEYKRQKQVEYRQRKAAELAALLLLSVKVCGGILIFVAGVLGWWWIARQRHEQTRMRDGAWARRSITLPWPMRMAYYLRGQLAPMIDYDPNLNVGPATVISQYGVHAIEPAAGWDRQLAYAMEQEKTNRTRAAITGDAAQSLPWFVPAQSGKISAPMGRMLAGAYDKQPRQITTDPSSTPPAEAMPQLLKLGDALNQARPDHWLAGQNLDNGQVAAFDPVRHVHAGIVGSTGTGKTSSVGFGFVAQALKTGYHVVILDPKGGADWRPWAGHCEWCESDSTTFGDQIQAIWNEHERRTAMLRDGQAANVRLLPAPPSPVVVVVEEYGDTIALMRRTNRKAADATDATLDRLMRLSRATDIHLILIDQYPEEWSPQVMAGASRWLACFQLAPGQGAKVGEYKAAELPANGAFLHKTHTYDSWFVKPDVFPQLLQRTPASQAPRVIDGQCSPVHSASSGEFTAPVQGSSPRVTHTPAVSMNSVPDTVDGWYEWTLDNYLPTHTELLRTENGRGVGVKALAETMAVVARGNALEYEAFKGSASEVAKRLRNEVALPRGDRLGVDVTTEAT